MSEVKLSNEIKLILPRKLVLISLLFSAAIILIGVHYYKSESKRYFKERENSLSAIANLKIEEIEHLHKERIGDAATIKENELLKNQIYTAVLGTILLLLITTSIFGFWIWNHRVRLFHKQVKIEAKFRESEEKLRNSEELFSKLFHNMLNGFAYCKMLYEKDDLIDFIYINVNDAFESLTGLRNVNGKKVSEVIPGIQQSDPDLLKRYARVALTGKPEVFETWVESMKMWFLISVYSPQKEYFVAVFDVITARKQAEEVLQELNEKLEARVILRTEQLEIANKELEAFSYSVSHDLRAPLRAVHSYTNILMEEYEDKLDEEGKRLCRIISSGAIQMGGLIDDLLSFSRIGRSTLNPAVLEMTSIVKSGLDEASDECRKNKTTFTLGNLHKVKGDPGLIKLVWNNLISNAIKYSSKANNPEIKIGSVQENGSITYYIRDNGVGFDMQYEHKLFGVFQRLHSEREFEGNGVGLAIVQRIIHKHNGKVWAEGEIGKGATFYFSLPANGEDKRKGIG